VTSPEPRVVQPAGWPPPRGYANGVLARGRLLFIAGQIAWDAHGQFRSDDFVDQTRQALQNVRAVLEAAGGRPQHLVRLTWYVRDRADYLAQQQAIGQVYREVLGRHFPAMTLVEVAALLEDRARVEIEATAVLPDEDSPTAVRPDAEHLAAVRPDQDEDATP
jgi:enamine deaminase RidA (YjgF/YER057c/UK114 family)